MASEANAPGKFYVDADYCLCSGNCVAVAPGNFKLVMGHAVVYKQPETPDEQTQCEEAWHDCPVRAINDDGAA
jgi:ferredoxin